MKPRLLTLAHQQALVFSAVQAELAGVAARERRNLVSSRVWRELRRGIYTVQSWWDEQDVRGRHRIELAGALLIRGWDPDSPTHTLVGGHRTAAYLHGLPFQPPAEAVAAAAHVDNLRDLTRRLGRSSPRSPTSGAATDLGTSTWSAPTAAAAPRATASRSGRPRSRRSTWSSTAESR